MNTFSSVNFARALDPEGVPPGYFKDKIVMIGGRSAVGYLAVGRDEFGTPYSRESPIHSGLEVHATILLNLLRGEWLTRLPKRGVYSYPRWLAGGGLGRPASLSRVDLSPSSSRLGVGLLVRLARRILVQLDGAGRNPDAARSRLVGRFAIPP